MPTLARSCLCVASASSARGRLSSIVALVGLSVSHTIFQFRYGEHDQSRLSRGKDEAASARWAERQASRACPRCPPSVFLPPSCLSTALSPAWPCTASICLTAPAGCSVTASGAAPAVRTRGRTMQRACLGSCLRCAISVPSCRHLRCTFGTPGTAKWGRGPDERVKWCTAVEGLVGRIVLRWSCLSWHVERLVLRGARWCTDTLTRLRLVPFVVLSCSCFPLQRRLPQILHHRDVCTAPPRNPYRSAVPAAHLARLWGRGHLSPPAGPVR